ncbi:MAG: DUF3368 domain-containing protein [Acidobacteriota bacterium]|nr:DUF3368 domain-containing protein [Blastocatellia bacterium]MDW8240437.1 DUF3368 domain-containing protein [Acidobacteriota bacterium]
MIVISNTTPINYLVLIDHIYILPELFGRVVIPEAVLYELQSPAAPDKIQRWIASPEWLMVQRVETTDPALAHLDAGEREGITLAEQMQADLILIDEGRGRQTAKQRGLAVTGTIGLLDYAAARGLIDFVRAVELLRQTSFRAAPHLLQALLDRHRQED